MYQQLPKNNSNQYRSTSLNSIKSFTNLVEPTDTNSFTLTGGGEYGSMLSSSSGYIGTGTTNPSNTLHVSSQPSIATYTTASSIKL